MSNLTLDEVIKHCLEVAEQKECKMTSDDGYTDVSMKQCAADHRQLADWLRELKDLREENKVLISECDRLIKEKGELLKKSEQVAEYKRLLKAAVEDIHELLCDKKNLDGNGQSCNICSYIEWCPCCKECTIRENLRNWRYADEAEKLLKEEV